MSANECPLDFDNLQKGDVISIDTIEKLSGMNRDHKNFGLKVLYWMGVIERSMAIRKVFVTCQVQNGSIKILTDQEASLVNDDRCRLALSSYFRSHERNLAVDMSHLDNDNERKRHLRTLEIYSRVAQAIREARKVSLETTRRITPRMIGHDE